MQHEPSKPFMNDHIKKAAERLLTGHYAPQDVIDVCRAATEEKVKDKTRDPSPPTGLELVLSGAVVEHGMRGIGKRAIVTAVRGYVDGWPNEASINLQASSGSRAAEVIISSREVDIYIAPHKSFPPPPPTGWVSVKDRLPENGQRVIAHYAGVYDHRVVEFWYNDPEHYHFGSPHEPDGRGSQPATHWHPMPAIPS